MPTGKKFSGTDVTAFTPKVQIALVLRRFTVQQRPLNCQTPSHPPFYTPQSRVCPLKHQDAYIFPRQWSFNFQKNYSTPDANVAVTPLELSRRFLVKRSHHCVEVTDNWVYRDTPILNWSHVIKQIHLALRKLNYHADRQQENQNTCSPKHPFADGHEYFTRFWKMLQRLTAILVSSSLYIFVSVNNNMQLFSSSSISFLICH